MMLDPKPLQPPSSTDCRSEKRANPHSTPKNKQRRRKQKTQKHHPTQLLNSPARKRKTTEKGEISTILVKDSEKRKLPFL